MARKWQDLAPPDDPGSWYDVDGFWPTDRGTYETVNAVSSTTDYTASGASAPSYAFSDKLATQGSTSSCYYIVDGGQIWSNQLGTLTNKKGSVSFGNTMQMAQYGDITMGAQGATTYSGGAVAGGDTIYANSRTGANFAVMTAAPQASYIAIASNVVGLFRTGTDRDGYAMSDVGDYTNWTTGEATSGRIISAPGDVTGAVSMRGAIYVFKPTSIHRMTYVGGAVKWLVEKVVDGLGGSRPATDGNGILFLGGDSADRYRYYYYDGVTRPVLVNPFTTIGVATQIIYSAYSRLFVVWEGTAKTAYYFSPDSMAWGKHVQPYGNVTVIPVDGPLSIAPATAWGFVSSNSLREYAAISAATGATYLQTAKIGRPDGKTTFDRVIPLVRRRTDLGSDSAVCSLSLFREREDTAAQTTQGSVSESGFRKRFDFKASSATDNYARVKVTYTALDMELDDFLVKSRFVEDSE